MDPGVLFGSEEIIRQRVRETIEAGRGQRHVMNLGHGVMVSHIIPVTIKVSPQTHHLMPAAAYGVLDAGHVLRLQIPREF